MHLSQSVLGALLHQRGQLPLHASAVLVDGGCIGFLGDSKQGKSTLAAALRRRGRPTLCDDVCAVTFAGGTPVAWPGIRRVKLRADAAEAVGQSTEKAPRVHPGDERYGFPEESPLPDRPYPLRRLYVLRKPGGESEGISRLRGIEAVRRLMDFTYRPQFVEALAGGTTYFAAWTAVARSVGLFAWVRPWGLDRLASALDALEEHLACEPA
jgi:hypothetical protein